MSIVTYTETEEKLINIPFSNLDKIPIKILEDLSSYIDNIAEDDEIIGFYVNEIKSKLTDSSCYELIVKHSYNRDLCDWKYIKVSDFK